MKPSETNTSDTGLGMASVLQRAKQEVENLKKANLNPKSKYWRPINKRVSMVEASVTSGVKEDSFGVISKGVLNEWAEGYEHFCNQTVNTKGQKVNRKALKKHAERWMSRIKFGKQLPKEN
tara:strand:+ start:1101 stop:1463 length:363 start_codon:yes stop_codon:yes gene_type:complete